MSEDTRKALELAREALEWPGEHGANQDDVNQAIAAIDAALSAPAAPVAQGVSDITTLKAELWNLAVRKGLVTVHTERLSPTNQRTKVSWLEGHAKACDVSNVAAHGITKGEA